MQVAIIGLGLMGGSLGLALRRRRPGWTVTAYARRAVTRRRALAMRAAHRVFASPEDAVRGADVVVLCLPVCRIPVFLRKCRSSLKPGCVVTDVGSTKEYVVRECERLLAGLTASFVGSHPMAGSDQSGLESADANLYAGATVIVTPRKGSARAAGCVTRLWKALRARVVVMPPAFHDRVVAATSHVPHLVAGMLVDLVSREGESALKACGPGFRDATRIAAGPEDVWLDIVRTNRAAVSRSLRRLELTLKDVRRMVDREDSARMRSFLARNRRRRAQWETGRGETR